MSSSQQNERILLSLPHMSGHEQEWIDKAFQENWVVPLGPNVDEFERRLSRLCGGKPVVALSAGTAAIHLALVMLGVGPGDEVLCQSFTFSASANPVAYCGASPVFVGSEPGSWNMDPLLLERAIQERRAATGRAPKAIIPVWLYGMPPRMDAIMEVAQRYGIPVVEDAAEALGSTFSGRPSGTFGTYGALSFNGNKIITTSGGGALICPDEEAAARVKFFATQARENRPYYYHECIGYNYRLSNICAGIGCAQAEVLPLRVEQRRAIHEHYTRGLAGIPGLEVKQEPSPLARSNFWLTTIVLDPALASPLQVMEQMAARGIETRMLWRPMHMQPVFARTPVITSGVEDALFARGLCLPSGSGMDPEQQERVIAALREILGAA